MDVAEMTGDTKTGAVREALREKKRRLEVNLLWPADARAITRRIGY